MELALYDPAFGYYARAAQRSGRAGDFFTSVDVGPVFGELLEIQLAEMATMLQATAEPAKPAEKHALRARRALRFLSSTWSKPAPATAACPPTSCARRAIAIPISIRTLVSTWSRPAPQRVMRRRRCSATSSTACRPPPRRFLTSFEGVLIANELLDAFPVHQVVMREDGLREVYVAAASEVRHEDT